MQAFFSLRDNAASSIFEFFLRDPSTIGNASSFLRLRLGFEPTDVVSISRSVGSFEDFRVHHPVSPNNSTPDMKYLLAPLERQPATVPCHVALFFYLAQKI